jgi:hypothetical protein
MEFSWEPRLETGGCALGAHAEEYDGQPTPGILTMDFAPRFSSPIRVAAAATLAFRPYIAGGVTFPDKVSPELATRVSALLEPATTFPGPLEFHPKAMPVGTGTLTVEADGVPGLMSPGDIAGARLRLTSAGHAFGQHVTPTITYVPTNAYLLEPSVGDDLERALPYLACAVLLAQDFGVGTLRLPSVLAEAPRASLVTDLLFAAGLSLVFDAVPSGASERGRSLA